MKDLDLVAWRTVRPWRDSSPSRDSAMTLSAARAAGDEDRGLGVGTTSPFDGVEHIVVGVSLLVEEHEHLAVLDLLGGNGEQLARRRDAARSQHVGIPCAALAGGEARAEEVLELAAPLSGVETPVAVALEPEEVLDARVGCVVQVCRAGE